MPLIRFALPTDAARIAEIFRPYVLGTAVTFATEPPTAADFTARFSAPFPFLVLERAGRVVAYAYASAHRPLASYRWGAEVSLYVDLAEHRRGHGARLYRALFALLREQGILKAYAVVTLPNAGSVALHEKFGFHHFARFAAAGFKLGEWRDVGWWELSLTPQMPIPPGEIQSIAAVREKRSSAVQVILSESHGDP
jgi:L-amino acid N-acyltransferase YncA